MDKKTYLAIVVIITILLFAAMIVRIQQGILNPSALDEVFGYIYLGIIAVGIVGLIWFLVKYPRKAPAPT
jgi:hypothetical protein